MDSRGETGRKDFGQFQVRVYWPGVTRVDVSIEVGQQGLYLPLRQGAANVFNSTSVLG